MPKYYLVDEEALRDFLVAEHTVAILDKAEYNYGIGLEVYNEYIAEMLGNLPWNEYKTAEDLRKIAEEEGYGVYSLARDQVEAFWVPHHITPGEWIVTNGKNHKCSLCGDIYHFTYPYCPSCGAKMENGNLKPRG